MLAGVAGTPLQDAIVICADAAYAVFQCRDSGGGVSVNKPLP